MKIQVKIEDEPIFEIEVIKEYTYSQINDYALNHPNYKRFQYDSQRHSAYIKEARENIWLNGYLIDYSKKQGESGRVLDCRIKLKYSEEEMENSRV